MGEDSKTMAEVHLSVVGCKIDDETDLAAPSEAEQPADQNESNEEEEGPSGLRGVLSEFLPLAQKDEDLLLANTEEKRCTDWCLCRCISGCCTCIRRCCRSWPYASMCWLLLFNVGAGISLSGARAATHTVDGLTDIHDIIVTYFAIAEGCMFYAMAFAVLSTGLCGEKFAQCTASIVYGDRDKCSSCCCPRCLTWVVWFSCCFLQWSGALAVFLIVASLALLIFLMGMMCGVFWLLYSVCLAGVAALTSLCPVYFLVSTYGRTIADWGGDQDAFAVDYEQVCTCDSGADSASGGCSSGWVVTEALTDACDDASDISMGITNLGIGLVIVIVAMVGMLTVSLRNRARVGGMLKRERKLRHMQHELTELPPTEIEDTANHGDVKGDEDAGTPAEVSAGASAVSLDLKSAEVPSS